MVRFLLACMLMTGNPWFLFGQFQVEGQFMQRAEFRNGYGRLLDQGEDHAAFIGHRARLQATWKRERLHLYMSVQDVRIWGSTPQLKSSDGFLSVHEVWAEYRISDTWSTRLGRQELNYDNFRFLGNVDWILPGRAHDVAMVRWTKGPGRLHFGAAYNQNGESLQGNLLTVPNQYKSAQFAHYQYKGDRSELTALFWNDGRQFTERNDQDVIIRQGIRYRATAGLPTLRYVLGKTTLNGFAYYQWGKDIQHRDIRTWNASAHVTRQVDFRAEQGERLRVSLGMEIISGTAWDETDVNRSFSPLYGTNHAHNGYMDYFYVSGRHEGVYGLQDFFLRSRFDFNTRLFVQGDLHWFQAQAAAADYLDAGDHLGTEVDLTAGYVLHEDVSLQAGYSRMFATEGFQRVSGRPDADPLQHWAYLMVLYRPNSKAKFVGLLL